MVSYIVIFMPHLHRKGQIGSVIKVLEDIGLVVQHPVKLAFTNKDVLEEIPKRTDLFDQWKAQCSESEYQERIKKLLLKNGGLFAIRFWHEDVSMSAKELIVEMRKRYPQYGLKNGSTIVFEDKTAMVDDNLWHTIIVNSIKMV